MKDKSVRKPSQPATEIVAKAPEPRRTWKRIAGIAAAAVSAISFITGVVAVIPILTRDATRFDSLVLTAEPFRPTVLDYAVPLDAPFDSFPLSDTTFCDPVQQAWLDEFGEVYTSRYMVTFQNNATEGSMLAMDDLRGEGDRMPPESTAIRVECDTTGLAPSNLRAARLDLSSSGDIAYFDDSALRDSPVPDSPVVLNLAPGEGAQLLLQLSSSARFDGAVHITVRSGSDERDVVLPLPSEVLVPGLMVRGDTFVRASGSLSCIQYTDGNETPCVLAEVLPFP